MYTGNQFQSEIHYTLPIHQEFSRLNALTYGRNILIYLLTTACIFYLITALESRYYRFLYLILFCVMGTFRIIRFFRRKKADLPYQHVLLRNDGEAPQQIVTFERDGIRSRNDNTGAEVFDEYDQIQYLMESENLLVLVSNRNTTHLIDKRSLSGGTRDELETYLRARCLLLQAKIRTGKVGKVCSGIMWGTLLVGMAVCLCLWLQIPQRLIGQITNDMSGAKMAEALASLDIVIDPATIAELEEYEAGKQNSLFDSQPPRVYALLALEGSGKLDPETQEWIPSTSGVYWFDMDLVDTEKTYTDFLNGINGMGEGLIFSDIREEPEDQSGVHSFSFTHLGEQFDLATSYTFSDFDTDMLYAVGRILAADADTRDLWMFHDGEKGMLLYYGTAEEKEALEKKTGIPFYDCVTMRMGH